MNQPNEKPKWPRDHALDVARELTHALTPWCDRIIVAGSLRRGKPLVGDVEIIYIPSFQERKVDMFTSAPWNLADECLAKMLDMETITKRPTKTGTTPWGGKNKLALHWSGMPVDFFSATAENWWNYLVCRTGPSESNLRICMEAQKRGWKWNPYGSGFSRPDGESHVVTSEEEVFAFVGLPFKEPRERA